MNIKEMSTEELRVLHQLIAQELKMREDKQEQKMVVYSHDCMGCSNNHRRKHKHWVKLVRGVNPTKANGYAFIGDFLSSDSQSKVPNNSIVVEVCGYEIVAYKVTETGKVKIAEAPVKAMSELIDAVGYELNNQ